MVGASLEAIYLSHILETMKELRGCFNDRDVETFSLYIEYLKSATLGEDIRIKIQADAVKLKEEMDKEKPRVDEKIKSFRIGFLVVREVMKYLNASLDLTHEDIIGQAYDLAGLSTLSKPEDNIDATDSPV